MKSKVYSIFILHDDNTWEQPSFRVVGDGADKLTGQEITAVAENHFGGFMSAKLYEDPDAREENIKTLTLAA